LDFDIRQELENHREEQNDNREVNDQINDQPHGNSTRQHRLHVMAKCFEQAFDCE
jgi:hypothetical protein